MEPTKSKEKKNKKNNSVFAEAVKTKDGSDPLTEAIVSQAKPTGEVKAEKEENEYQYVYEVSFNEENSSYLLFADSIALDDDFLALFGVFTRYFLQEIINPQEKLIVQETGRKELTEKDFTIPFIYGITIKKILKEDWMDRNEEDTKKVFDEKVLQAYRDYKASLLKLYNNTLHNQNHSYQEEDEEINHNRKHDNRYEGITRKEIKGL